VSSTGVDSDTTNPALVVVLIFTTLISMLLSDPTVVLYAGSVVPYAGMISIEAPIKVRTRSRGIFCVIVIEFTVLYFLSCLREKVGKKFEAHLSKR
jgi:hypothetical protein